MNTWTQEPCVPPRGRVQAVCVQQRRSEPVEGLNAGLVAVRMATESLMHADHVASDEVVRTTVRPLGESDSPVTATRIATVLKLDKAALFWYDEY